MNEVDGVHAVAATPFLPDELLDEASLRAIVDDVARAGCDGILILGVMGEADRLSDQERDRIVEVVVEQAGQRLQVTVGVTHQATIIAATRARLAARAGATAVMAAPPTGSAPGPALRDYFRRIADWAGVPIVVQDHPASSGVRMPAEFLAEVMELLPTGSAVKLEDPPTPPKIARLRELRVAAPILGGLGGLPLYQELVAGADGVMTGFAFPAVLVEIVQAYRAGAVERARRCFEEALPLIVFEAQPGVGVGLRKEILRRRGVIAHATVRQPAPAPDATTLRLLDDLLATTKLGGVR